MKTILAPITSTNDVYSVLQTVLALARRFDSYIEGFALDGSRVDAVGVEMSGLMIERRTPESEELARNARVLFESFMHENGVLRSSDTSGRLSYGWLDQVPAGNLLVGRYGRVFDAIVMARATWNSGVLQKRAIETALFESGRPVLLSPPSPPPQVGTNVLIAWNGSTEQTSAVALAMPVLQQAGRVTVLTVRGGVELVGPTADQVLRYLQRNEISADSLAVDIGTRSSAEAILDTADSLGCDLLIKGADTKSRLRQIIFGGTSQYIMTTANLPVLLAR